MLTHALFDVLAMVAAWLISKWFRQKYALVSLRGMTQSAQQHYYLLVLLLGLLLGSIGFGTLNLFLAGKTGLAKSMLGGIVGAIVAAELFKYFAGIRQSTGLYFVPGLIVLIVVGRIGCFLAGLPDFTYGTSTILPWGVDFGDGIARHPVQLYESLTMTLLLVVLLWHYPLKPIFWQQQGFYIFILIYALQRFIWEFLKPYPVLFGGLGLFQWLCLGLIIYALALFWRTSQESV